MNISNINVATSVNTFTQSPVAAPSANSEAAPVQQDTVNLKGSSQGGKFSGCSADVRQLINKMGATSGCELEKLTVVQGTDGNDEITVKHNPDWSYKITVNGQEKDYSQSEFRNLIIDGGKGNDTIAVDQGITSNTFITGGEGNDTIVGGKGSDVIIDNYGSNFIKGSAGNDTIIAGGFDLTDDSPANPAQNFINANINGNIIVGGSGNDYIEAGQTSDLIEAGSGNDTVYGMGGNDVIATGSGTNYADAGAGNDYVRGGKDHNMLFGGSGSDTLQAGSGKNVIASGTGSDAIIAKGTTSAVITDGDQVQGQASVSMTVPTALPTNVKAGSATAGNSLAAPGSPDSHDQQINEAFQARVQSDLEAMASTPTGQVMLSELEKLGKDVTIAETDGGNSCGHSKDAYMNNNKSFGAGSDSTVNYNRSRIQAGSLKDWSERPPLVGLYHEMAHSYNSAQGSMDFRLFDSDGYESGRWGTSGAEFQAVGIPSKQIAPNPPEVTENGLREFLQLPRREEY